MAEATAYQKVEREEDVTSEGEHEDAAWRHIDDHVRRTTALGWVRLLAEFILVVAVIGLASRLLLHGGDTQRGANEPRKQCQYGLSSLQSSANGLAVGFVNKVFMNDTRFANEDALADPEKLRETLKEWLPMSSSMCLVVWRLGQRLTETEGRGYVRVPVEEREGMDGPPYLLNPLMRPGKKEAYMLSGMHQLHCLVSRTSLGTTLRR